MMITIKSPKEIQCMREAGRITAEARSVGAAMLRDGITTDEVEKAIHRFILSKGAVPTFRGYIGFPKSACISVNDEVIHGIPGKRVIHSGDIVSIDVGATYKGFVGDCAGTYGVGEISPEAEKLIRVTRESFFEGLKSARAGNRLHDISGAIQAHNEANGFSLVRDYVGHGIGRNMHEDPEIPNYVPPKKERRPNPRLTPGMTLAVEPMVNAGGYEVRKLSNGWTVVTCDGSLSAHYENTILITDGEPEILTFADNI